MGWYRIDEKFRSPRELLTRLKSLADRGSLSLDIFHLTDIEWSVYEGIAGLLWKEAPTVFHAAMPPGADPRPWRERMRTGRDRAAAWLDEFAALTFSVVENRRWHTGTAVLLESPQAAAVAAATAHFLGRADDRFMTDPTVVVRANGVEARQVTFDYERGTLTRLAFFADDAAMLYDRWSDFVAGRPLELWCAAERSEMHALAKRGGYAWHRATLQAETNVPWDGAIAVAGRLAFDGVGMVSAQTSFGNCGAIRTGLRAWSYPHTAAVLAVWLDDAGLARPLDVRLAGEVPAT